MKALVLAAGRSKRMAPIGDKNFLNFLGKPLIWHQLKFLEKNGVEAAVVIGSNTNLQMIGEVTKDIQMAVEVCEQKDLDLGMAGAVMAAKGLVNDDEEILIVSGNDVVEDKAVVAVMAATGADCYLLGKKVDSYFPGGYLEVNDEGFIEHIVEKPGEGNEPSDMVNLVVHRFDSFGRLMGYLEKASSEDDDLYEVALAAMMKDGVKFKAVPYSGSWFPIKFPWHVHDVWKFLFDRAEKGVNESVLIAEGAVISGEVIIEEGVKIFEGAVVKGPCFIGSGSIVANNALVRESHLGAGSVAGFNTEVARSYVSGRLRTHMNYVGDSVIEDNVSFGAGTVTGNLRLDEGDISVVVKGAKVNTGSQKVGAIIGRNVRVGINTSLMPGVKIGSDSFIGAGIVLAENVEERSFVRGSFELKVSENRSDVPGQDS